MTRPWTLGQAKPSGGHHSPSGREDYLQWEGEEQVIFNQLVALRNPPWRLALATRRRQAWQSLVSELWHNLKEALDVAEGMIPKEPEPPAWESWHIDTALKLVKQCRDLLSQAELEWTVMGSTV